MKHVEIYKEIENKVNEMCHEALKAGGIVLFNAVHQLSIAVNQLINYKKPEEQPAETPKEGE